MIAAVSPSAASAARAPGDVLLGSLTVPFASPEEHTLTGVTFVKDENYTFEVSGAGLAEYSIRNDSCRAVPDQPCVYRRDALYCYDSTFDNRCGSGKSYAIPGLTVTSGWWVGWSPSTPYNPGHKYSATVQSYGTNTPLKFGSFFGRQGNCGGPEEREPVCSGTFLVEVWGPDPDPPPGSGEAGRCSAAAMLRASASTDRCKLGKLPIGERVSVAAPEPGKTTNVSPVELPPETRGLIAEILFEREVDRIALGLAAKYPGKGSEVLASCIAFGEPLLGLDPDKHVPEYAAGSARRAALFKACAEILLGGSSVRAPRAAARGCPVRVVPLFRKGAKVTDSDRARARRAITRRLRPACKIRGGDTLSASLAARGAKPLTRIIGRHVGAPVARRSTTPAGDRRMRVKWTAKKKR